MRFFIIVLMLLNTCFYTKAQTINYDSIKKIMQQDSIEYAKQLEDANRIKNQTDSILKNELGPMQSIAPPDSAAVIANLKMLAAAEIEKQRNEETKRYYLFIAAIVFLVLMVLVAFKRKQFAKVTDKN